MIAQQGFPKGTIYLPVFREWISKPPTIQKTREDKEFSFSPPEAIFTCFCLFPLILIPVYNDGEVLNNLFSLVFEQTQRDGLCSSPRREKMKLFSEAWLRLLLVNIITSLPFSWAISLPPTVFHNQTCHRIWYSCKQGKYCTAIWLHEMSLSVK